LTFLNRQIIRTVHVSHNLVPRVCDPREGTRGSGIICFREESDWLLKWNAQFNLSQDSWLPATDYPRGSRSFPRIAGSGNEIDVSSCYKLHCNNSRLNSQQLSTTNLEIKGYSSYFQDVRLIVFKAIGRPPETFSIIQCSRFYNIQLGYKLFTVWYPKPNCSILWISGYCKFQTLFINYIPRLPWHHLSMYSIHELAVRAQQLATVPVCSSVG
jgi:hypothetical protein